MSLRRLAPLSFACLALLGACGPDAPAVPDEPRWVHLAEGFVPSWRLEAPRDWMPSFLGGEALGLRPHEGGPDSNGGVWVEMRLPREAWKPSYWPGVWHAKRPIWGVGLPDGEGAEPQRLEAEGESFRYVPFSKELSNLAELEVGVFCGVVENVYLIAGEAGPPEECTYSVYVDRGSMEGGRWRVPLGRFTADGFALWPGEAEELSVDLPPASALRFATAGLSSGTQLGRAAGELTFRVFLDDTLVFEEAQPVSDLADLRYWEVPLPAEGREGARLRFEASGRAALSAVLNPIVGPAESGRRGDRAWGDERPDLVVFLADTFRADNMALYGGEQRLTPNLDAFAGRSVAFLRAWSPASWTLPSQASLMTGLWPHQHGSAASKLALAQDAVTLAEALAARGYRTGAITDALLVSQRFGFDQGFEVFDEELRTLDQTLEAARHFLAADDGRPTFLFLQTYRTHSPYHASAETRAKLADRFPVEGDWASLNQELAQSLAGWDGKGAPPAASKRAIERLRNLYWAGVHELDAGFGGFVRELEAESFFEDGYLFFTSDHGEAFGEHDVLFHGNGVWDANVRIPLLLAGPGLTAKRVEAAASLIDIPTTIASLLDMPAPASWGGESLLDLPPDRLAWSFVCPAAGGEDTLAFVEGERKVLAPFTIKKKEVRAREAYLLSEDPHEEVELISRGATWPAERLEAHHGSIAGLLKQRFQPETAHLSPEDLRELEAAGYVDTADEP